MTLISQNCRTPAGGYNLDKALELAEHLEDEEIARKLELNK